MSDSHSLVKCLIWDLDNTLWQGTLSEDAEVFLTAAVREVVHTLDSRGILQSIASKNDYEPAWSRLQELGVAEFFVIPRIGWGRKSDAVREIADKLRFAHHTVGFIDDQPAERSEVAFHLPQVRCYPAERVMAITGLPEFSPKTVTVDSRRRRQMYQAGLRRSAAWARFNGPDERFLRSLDLQLQLRPADDAELSRVEELTVRTSQMNATGVHYPHAALRRLLGDPTHRTLVATLTDRFGTHGAIGVVLLDRHPHTWHLKLLATSCRVVSFGVGAAILGWLIDQAARSRVHLVADFRSTGRNRMMEIAYRFAGFTDQQCTCSSTLAHEPDIQRLHLIPTHRARAATMRLVAPDLTRLDNAPRPRSGLPLTDQRDAVRERQE